MSLKVTRVYDMMYPELHINNMTTESDVIEMIKDNIDMNYHQTLMMQKDYLDQFKEYLVKKEAAIQQLNILDTININMPINYDNEKLIKKRY